MAGIAFAVAVMTVGGKDPAQTSGTNQSQKVLKDLEAVLKEFQ